MQDVPLETVGAKVREKRLALGLTIRKLAEMAMVSKTSIVNLEVGKSCRPATLVKVSAAMGFHLERFIEPEVVGESSGRVHRQADDRWFSLLGLDSGPVEGDRSLSLEERDRLRAAGSGPLMLMFRNVPVSAGFVAGVIELDSVSEPRRHPGQEFVYVLRGAASVRVGTASYELLEGESLYFEGSEEHTYGPLPGRSGSVSLFCIRVD